MRKDFYLQNKLGKGVLSQQKKSKNTTSDNKIFFSHYSKAQISMEVLSYYIILTGVFLVTLVLIVNSQTAINEEKTILDARNTLVFVKNEVDIAASVGDGYTHSFFLPEVLEGSVDYDISLSGENQEISIVYRDRNISLSLLTDNITNTIKRGNNVIKNTKGMIIFE